MEKIKDMFHYGSFERRIIFMDQKSRSILHLFYRHPQSGPGSEIREIRPLFHGSAPDLHDEHSRILYPRKRPGTDREFSG